MKTLASAELNATHKALRLLAVAVLATAPAFALGCASDTSDTEESSDEALMTNKTAFAGAYKSPSIVRDGATYHAYFAQGTFKENGNTKTFNVPHASFNEKDVWSNAHEALPNLGKGAAPNGLVWAPGVAQISANHWMLYYTAHLASTGSKMCIWRAHASTAAGPFVDDYDGPLVCQNGSEWAIDPYPVQDAQGTWALGVRYDLGNGINSIQIRELNDTGTHFKNGSSFQELTKNEQGSWDQHVMENAGIVRLAPDGNGPGHWFVFYSARHWDDDSYAIGVADCGTTLLDASRGHCKKLTPNGPWMGTNANQKLYGPGTPTFYTDANGDKMMSIQAWRYPGGVADGSPHKEENRAQGQIMRTYKMSVDGSYEPKAKLTRVDM